MSKVFSFYRAFAVFQKELIQMRRDKLFFAMMVVMPVMQLLLFGYAINTDPRHLPTVIEQYDSGPATRAILHGLNNSEYFKVLDTVKSRTEAEAKFLSGEALFIVSIPPNFERDLLQGRRPQILLDIDASDPVAASAGAGAFSRIVERSLKYMGGDVMQKPAEPYQAEPVIHKRYNAAGRTAVNIVPGLLGVILTMTMTLMTSIALTRESERGTLETLLASPVRSSEVMFGKVTPFILAAGVQLTIMISMASFLFEVPFRGDVGAFLLAVFLFVLANLAVGFLFSTLVKTQMQAMQLTMFYFLPSMLLTGFMFPFAGMPAWAQTIGEALPNTHFMRVVRATMLKGAEFTDVSQSIISLGVILAVVTGLALMRYRTTLD